MKRIFCILAVVFGLVSWGIGLEEAVLREAASRWIARSVVLKQEGVDFRVLGMEHLKDDEGSPLPMVAMSLEPDGFLVICTDDRLPTVLAFSPTGRFSNDAEGLPRLLRHQGKKYVECLAPTRGNDLQGAYAKNSEEWEALLGGVTRGPLDGDPNNLIQPAQLMTIWRQDHPFNLLMPASSNGIAFRGLVGCVPLAYAQLMEWNQWPPRGKGQKSYENVSSEVNGTLSADFTLDYNWALLEDHDFSDVFSDPITATDREVARLLLDLVVGARAAVGLGSTSSGLVAIAKVLESHLYYQRPTFWASQDVFGTKSELSVVHSKLREEVKSGWPALAIMPGHVYVASGYGKQNNVEYFYYNYGWKTEAVINGWYRLDDGFQGDASALFGCGVGTRPLPIPMFRPINRVQGTAVTVEWDFPKRLTSQGFRLSKQVGGPGAPLVVVSNAIEGTARSFNLTGLEPGNVALTLEAKVGGSWQEASEPLELTIVQGDAPVDVGLTCPVDETCFLDDAMSFDVTSQVPLESLEVTTSRVDIIPSDGIQVEDLGGGTHWRVTLEPVGDREAFALLWVKGMTASGCEEAKSVFLRVLKRPMLKAICVTLYPEGVGAWRIVGSDNWLDSGEAAEVETGTYTVEFQDVEGWTTPAQRTMSVGDVEVGLMESYSPVPSGGGFGVLVTADWTGGDMPKSMRLIGGVATNQDVEAPFDVPAWLEADNEAKLVDFEAPGTANSLQWTLEASVIGTESLQLTFTNVNIPESWQFTVTDCWGQNVALDTPIVLDRPGHYCYEIRLGKCVSQEVILRPGWTLLGLNLVPNPNSNLWNYEPKTLANGNYIPVENLNPGDAFWIFNDDVQGVQTFQVLGMAPNNDEVEANTAKIQNLKPGTWTFIGTLNELILDAGEFLIWEWGDNGYQRPADNKLIPEKGYWLKRK